MGSIHKCLMVSDRQVGPASLEVSIALTWPFTHGPLHILNEFISASTLSVTPVQGFSVCFPSEIIMGPGCERL